MKIRCDCWSSLLIWSTIKVATRFKKRYVGKLQSQGIMVAAAVERPRYPTLESTIALWTKDASLQALVAAEGRGIDVLERCYLASVLHGFIDPNRQNQFPSFMNLAPQRNELLTTEFYPSLSGPAEDCPQFQACKHLWAKGIITLIDVRPIFGEFKPIFRFSEKRVDEVIELAEAGKITPANKL